MRLSACLLTTNSAWRCIDFLTFPFIAQYGFAERARARSLAYQYRVAEPLQFSISFAALHLSIYQQCQPNDNNKKLMCF